MRINLACEYAQHDEKMRLRCRKSGGYCAHQYYRQCRGWWENTPQANNCTLKERAKNGT